jgi:hypothetical protein
MEMLYLLYPSKKKLPFLASQLSHVFAPNIPAEIDARPHACSSEDATSNAFARKNAHQSPVRNLCTSSVELGTNLYTKKKHR